MSEGAIVRYGLPDDGSEPELAASAVVFGGLLLTTQIPDRPDGSLELGDVRLQSRQVLQNLADCLAEAGTSMAHLLHVTIYLTDMADREVFNEEWLRHVPQPVPARCCVEVSALAFEGMRVELTAHAAVV